MENLGCYVTNACLVDEQVVLQLVDSTATLSGFLERIFKWTDGLDVKTYISDAGNPTGVRMFLLQPNDLLRLFHHINEHGCELRPFSPSTFLIVPQLAD